MKINYENYFLIAKNVQELLTISVNPSGTLVINQKLLEKINPQKADVFMAKNYESIVLSPSENGSIKFPKSGAIKIPEITQNITRQKKQLPIRYSMQWDPNEKIWFGKKINSIHLPKKKAQISLEDLL